MLIWLKGKIIPGKQQGREIGFPTLNIAYSGEDSGVFAGRAKIDNQWFAAAINLGARPTVDGEWLCEIHVLDWSGSTEMVEVELWEKVRDVRKFASLEDLRVQLAKDVEFVRSWYNPDKYV